MKSYEIIQEYSLGKLVSQKAIEKEYPEDNKMTYGESMKFIEKTLFPFLGIESDKEYENGS